MLENEQLRIVCCDLPMAQAVILGDNESLAQLLSCSIPEVWTEFGAPAFQWTVDQLSQNPDSAGWWSYLPILKENNTLVGSCGYKGPANEDGMVEIGYEVARDYRNRGIAGAMVDLLVQHAFANSHVTTVWAHTLAEENASVHVLRRNGFVFTGAHEDPDDGPIWRWEKMRGQ
ncbi:MAG: GNAT family N-acetyltransferase [Saprospiraceae bacterium]|nr:GNAT family N-acetyltransferase [Saprospiraceae bacterium]